MPVLGIYAEHDWAADTTRENGFVCTQCAAETTAMGEPEELCFGPPHLVAGERLRWLLLIAQRRSNDLLAQLIRVLKERT
jgi:hypothetical protein